MDALRRIVQSLRLSALETEKTTGMSGAQLFVLQTLARTGAPASIGELAAGTRTDQSSVSVVVRRLEERGLVSRRSSPADARRTEVSLTRKGSKLALVADPPAQARLAETLESFAPAKLVRLRSGLEELVGGMGIEHQPARLFFEEPARRTGKKAARS
jgi:DNA-binding MarR family transcriptional regulator